MQTPKKVYPISGALNEVCSNIFNPIKGLMRDLRGPKKRFIRTNLTPLKGTTHHNDCVMLLKS